MSLPNLRNRIVSYGTRPAKDFLANPMNYRRHPVRQREALRGALNELGWIGVVIENIQTGHLIDGHARIEEALSHNEDQLVPYIEVDLTPDEEKLALTTYDPLGAMATADRPALETLLAEIKAKEPALQALLKALAYKHGMEYGDPVEVEDDPPVPKERTTAACRCECHTKPGAECHVENYN